MILFIRLWITRKPGAMLTGFNPVTETYGVRCYLLQAVRPLYQKEKTPGLISDPGIFYKQGVSEHEHILSIADIIKTKKPEKEVPSPAIHKRFPGAVKRTLVAEAPGIKCVSTRLMAYYYTMLLIYRYRKWRSKWRRRKRLLFISPAEATFISIMGGWTFRLIALRTFSGCQLVILYDLGKVLKSWNMERELKVGKYFVDFGNGHKALEIDGRLWHMNVVADAERDAYLMARGFDVLHVRTSELKNPIKVRAKVEAFLSK